MNVVLERREEVSFVLLRTKGKIFIISDVEEPGYQRDYESDDSDSSEFLAKKDFLIVMSEALTIVIRFFF